ncbi:Dbl homology domain-containing protein [Fennellomyces sp. T-0311]|nr:Dbl homology domain-containing protein [Fennellomyces sp. T-0311]
MPKKRDTWATTVSNEILQSTPTHEQNRQEAVYALIRNERHYRADLESLNTRLVEPLYEFDRIDPAIRKKFIRAIFKNFDEIRQTNQKLTLALIERQRDFESLVPTVSDLFASYLLPSLDTYEEYCSNLPRATYLLTTSTEFPVSITQPHWPLLRKPLEHLERYPPLFEAVISATEDDHPDHEVLSLCRDTITTWLEQLKQTLERRQAVLDVEKWVGNKWQMDAPHRAIIYRCTTERNEEIIVMDHYILIVTSQVIAIPLPILLCVPSKTSIMLAHPPRGITYPVQLKNPNALLDAIINAKQTLNRHSLWSEPLVSSSVESFTAAALLPDQETLVAGSQYGVTLYPSRERILHNIDVVKLFVVHHYLVVQTTRDLALYKINHYDNFHLITQTADCCHGIGHYVVYQDRNDLLVHVYNTCKRKVTKTIDVQGTRVSNLSTWQNKLVITCDDEFIIVDILGRSMRRRISVPSATRKKALGIVGDGYLCYNQMVYTMEHEYVCDWEIRPKYVVYQDPYLVAFDQKQCIEMRHAETGALAYMLYEERCRLIGPNDGVIHVCVQTGKRQNISTLMK